MHTRTFKSRQNMNIARQNLNIEAEWSIFRTNINIINLEWNIWRIWGPTKLTVVRTEHNVQDNTEECEGNKPDQGSDLYFNIWYVMAILRKLTQKWLVRACWMRYTLPKTPVRYCKMGMHSLCWLKISQRQQYNNVKEKFNIIFPICEVIQLTFT